MAVPKKRTSSSRSAMRRAHDFLKPTHANVCANCGEATLRHRACPSCGQYRGRQIVKQAEESAETPAQA